jgi:hypothetical protein
VEICGISGTNVMAFSKKCGTLFWGEIGWNYVVISIKSVVEPVETPITCFTKAKSHGSVSTSSTTALSKNKFFYEKAIV